MTKNSTPANIADAATGIPDQPQQSELERSAEQAKKDNIERVFADLLPDSIVDDTAPDGIAIVVQPEEETQLVKLYRYVHELARTIEDLGDDAVSCNATVDRLLQVIDNPVEFAILFEVFDDLQIEEWTAPRGTARAALIADTADNVAVIRERDVSTTDAW